jgi:predicted transcriptional regulator
MSNYNGNRNYKIIEKFWLFASTIYTLVTAIIAAIVNKIWTGTPFETISIILFMIGVCTIIVQLIIFSYDIHDGHKSSHRIIEDINDNTNRHKNLFLPKELEKLSLKTDILGLVEKNEVHYIMIICYGTGGFDDLIPVLKRRIERKEKPAIITEVLVCSPTSKFLLFPEDERAINDVINDNEISNSIIFKKSPVPPTIRACVLYDKDKKPLWSSIQSYYFNYDVKRHSLDYRNSFAVIAQKDNNYKLLEEMESIIKEEFERLINFDLKKEGLNANQIKAVRHVEEKGEITKDDYMKIYNVKSSTAINNLTQLVDKGIFEKTSRTTKRGKVTESYILVKK